MATACGAMYSLSETIALGASMRNGKDDTFRIDGLHVLAALALALFAATLAGAFAGVAWPLRCWTATAPTAVVWGAMDVAARAARAMAEERLAEDGPGDGDRRREADRTERAYGEVRDKVAVAAAAATLVALASGTA